MKTQINVSIVICTYNRKEYVKKNIDILSKYCRSFIKHVFVIDNASNLPETFSNNFVSIIYNKNLGGSGGYARGMYEAKKDSKTTHILLMDDDIKFEYQTLREAVNKLNSIEKDDWFAFGMRTFENQNQLYENTAYWTGIRIKSNHRGEVFPNPKPYNIHKNNYAGWWSLIMPISVIEKYGYPMPYFIKSDDIEYGLRRTNEQIIYDNNITVLHEDFNKKYSHITDYYNIRNHIITDLLHFKNSLWKTFFVLTLRMGKAWLTGKYIKLELSLMGIKDLFLGSRFFKEADLEKNNLKVFEKSKNIKFNLFKFIFYPFIIMKYSILLLLKHNKLKQDFISEFKYLTSEKYWLAQF